MKQMISAVKKLRADIRSFFTTSAESGIRRCGKSYLLEEDAMLKDKQIMPPLNFGEKKGFPNIL